MDKRRSKWGNLVAGTPKEEFWEDVYRRTLSTLVTGYLVVAIAIFAGYIKIHGSYLFTLASLIASLVSTAPTLFAAFRIMDARLKRMIQ